MEMCRYTCVDGYGINGSQHEGTMTCNKGMFVWDQTTPCAKLPPTTTLPSRTIPAEEVTGEETTREPATTKRATTRAPVTTKRAVITTQAARKEVTVTKVKSSMVVKQVFPEGTTGATLLKDKGYVSSVEKGIAKGLGAGYTEDKVTVTDITLEAARRLTAEGRRLPEMSATIEYEIVVADEAEAKSVSETLEDPEKRKAFTESFTAAYAEAEKERTGAEPEGLEVIQSETTETTTEVATTVDPNATVARGGGGGGGAAAAAAEEEEGDGGVAAIIGGVFGGVGGICLLGGGFYVWRKRRQQASE